MNYLKTILGGYCPKCRKGKIFANKTSFSAKKNIIMHKHCPACGQKTELEVGFYYGTGYVSYALTVALSIMTFIAFWVIYSFPFSSTTLLIIWIVINTIVLILLQPIIMRTSRVIWLSWFV